MVGLAFIKDAKAARDAWQSRLTESKQGNLHATVNNGITILANDPAWSGVLCFSEFRTEIRTICQPPWDADDAPSGWQTGRMLRDQPWEDDDTTRASAWLARHYGFRAGPDVVFAALRVVAKRRLVHPVRDYLRGLSWDGVERVESFASHYLGVKDSAYARDVSHCLLVAAVARIFKPGEKVDTMVVFEGAQGMGKSTAIRKLFGADFYSDTPPDLNAPNNNRFLSLRGKWCIEWAEIDGLERGDVSRIKSFITSAVDDYREPYGRSNIAVPRQCVFVGTTNTNDYLRDVTGNRRFLPLKCTKIDLEAIEQDRDQLWAEAVESFNSGAQFYPDKSLATEYAKQQKARVAVDSWEQRIEEFVAPRRWTTVTEVLADALDVKPESHDQTRQNRVARALVKLGWRRAQKRVGQGERRAWGYVPGTTVTDADDEVVTP